MKMAAAAKTTRWRVDESETICAHVVSNNGEYLCSLRYDDDGLKKAQMIVAALNSHHQGTVNATTTADLSRLVKAARRAIERLDHLPRWLRKNDAGVLGGLLAECLADLAAAIPAETAEQKQRSYSPAVQQAFHDWNEHRAYVDNGGNYRVRPEAATPTHRLSGKIAPWNKEVKRLFPSGAEFHAAARESLEPRLLTEEEAQLVIGAIPLQALSPPATSGEWEGRESGLIVSTSGNVRFIARMEPHGPNGELDESDRAAMRRIIADHNAVPKLVAVLNSAKLLLLQSKPDEYTEETIADIDAALAATADGREDRP